MTSPFHLKFKGIFYENKADFPKIILQKFFWALFNSGGPTDVCLWVTVTVDMLRNKQTKLAVCLVNLKWRELENIQLTSVAVFINLVTEYLCFYFLSKVA